MTDIVVANNLTPDAFAASAQKFAEAAPRREAGGAPFLKMMKTDGSWVYGGDSVEVEEDSIWMVDPNTLCMGFIAWHAGKVEGEQMAFLGQETINAADLPPVAAKNGWEDQVGFGLICETGEDAGTKVIWKTNNHGGLQAWNKIFDAMKERSGTGQSYVPRIKMSHDSYTHTDYGKIYKPIFEIVGWQGDEVEQISKRKRK